MTDPIPCIIALIGAVGFFASPLVPDQSLASLDHFIGCEGDAFVIRGIYFGGIPYRYGPPIIIDATSCLHGAH